MLFIPHEQAIGEEGEGKTRHEEETFRGTSQEGTYPHLDDTGECDFEPLYNCILHSQKVKLYTQGFMKTYEQCMNMSTRVIYEFITFSK